MRISLLPLMILAILLVIVIVIFFPPRHTVQGSLQLQGLNRDDVGVVRQTAGSLRNLVAASARLATGALRQRNMDGGFLADPEAVSAMTEPVNSPFDEGRSQLQFRIATRNVEADPGSHVGAAVGAVRPERLSQRRRHPHPRAGRAGRGAVDRAAKPPDAPG